ncbi:hypothetical protein BHQ23_31415 [Mycobacterium gordonae]|jgi:hypothetical protein|nr:hypothetical protein BWK49_05720 [Mycobacterium intracellulare subsp. chimaera]ELR83586.1 hypothetical protein W7U_00060 [Mycobacterium sp. H4Y]KKC06274.1 hypothetical protein WU83_03985 [Mycobacterium nebraskense]ODR16015.1 hypothetical protein BHQ23_31415 [Mycobacterium gordonae]KPN54255.1 hypothetical protein AN932_03505 [Mycobacterium intracellulare subsp. chimaera]
MGLLPTAYGVRAGVVWPSDLALPSRPPALVYLDTFAYINLAKVAVGTAPPGYKDLFAACRQALADGRAMFPLSSTHVLEIYKIASVAQRRDVVAVMEELSEFNFLLGRPQIMELEFEAALNDLPTMTIAPQGHIPLVGTHMLHAFGKKGGIVFDGTTAEEASWWAEKICHDMGIDTGADPMASLNRWAMRQLVTGPDDHDDPALLRAGYSLDGWRDMLKQRAKRENDLVSKLDADPALRQTKLRDVINANELYVELGHLVDRAQTATGLALSQILEIQDPPKSECLAKIRNFNDGMPSTRVAASVKERYHSDRRHAWTTNDLQDIDALAIAMPYCDAAFIDKAARNQLVSSRELKFFETFLPRRPGDLMDWLAGLPTP